MTDVGEAIKEAEMVRQDRKRGLRVPISRAIVGAVTAAAHAANPRAQIATIMRLVVQPGDTEPELDPASTPEEPRDPAVLTREVLARAAERVAALRARKGNTP